MGVQGNVATVRVAAAQMTKIFIVASIEPPGPETRADGFQGCSFPGKKSEEIYWSRVELHSKWRLHTTYVTLLLIQHMLQPYVALM